jgi:hypothetical protein
MAGMRQSGISERCLQVAKGCQAAQPGVNLSESIVHLPETRSAKSEIRPAVGKAMAGKKKPEIRGPKCSRQRSGAEFGLRISFGFRQFELWNSEITHVVTA